MSITGQRLKERRKEIGVSADDVANELGVSRSTIFRYESGYIEKVPANVIEELAAILKTTPAFLMGWTDDSHDWEQIGNEEGIYPPKEYQGTYEDFVKYKLLEESDDLIDSYYDTYESAIDYLKKLGCQVTTFKGTNEIAIITPNNEHLKVNENDLVYNFMVFGASKPGIKKLITPRRIADLREDEDQLLQSYNCLNKSGRMEAQKRIDELAMLPIYMNKSPIVQMPDKSYLEPVAAHERTDIEVTDEMRQHDMDIMNNDDFWNK